MCEFLISENHFLISENQFNHFQISEIIFLISEIIFWYQKMPRFSDIRNHFLISENNFWYQKIEILPGVCWDKEVLYYVCDAWEQTRSWPSDHEQSRKSNEIHSSRILMQTMQTAQIETCHLNSKYTCVDFWFEKFSAVNTETMWRVCEMFTCVQMLC